MKGIMNKNGIKAAFQEPGQWMWWMDGKLLLQEIQMTSWTKTRLAGAGKLKPIWENIRDSEVTMRPAVLVAISSELCRMWTAPDLSNVYPPLSQPLPRVTRPQHSKLQWRALKVSFTCHVRKMFFYSHSLKNSLYSTFCSYKRWPQTE